MPFCIFDLDGTLIDSRADLSEAVNILRRRRGLPEHSVETVTSYLGNGMRLLAKRSFPDVDEANLDQLAAELQEAYESCMLHQTTLYPAVPETLAELSQKYHLVVVTNKPTRPTHAILRHLGIFPLFTEVLGGNDVSRLKPDPEPATVITRKTGLSLDGAWVVGDNWTDLQFARNIGAKACFCADRLGVQRDERADAVIRHFSQLSWILK